MPPVIQRSGDNARWSRSAGQETYGRGETNRKTTGFRIDVPTRSGHIESDGGAGTEAAKMGPFGVSTIERIPN